MPPQGSATPRPRRAASIHAATPPPPYLPSPQAVRFPEHLHLRAPFLAPNFVAAEPPGRAGAMPAYRLIGVVAHHGTTLSGGHYTCDVRAPGTEGGWFHCDDSNVKRVPLAEVLKRQAYVLFYAATRS